MTRWKDTLPSASPSLVSAARSLVLAIYAGEGWGRRTSEAAAHIRAYRKTLGVKSERKDLLAHYALESDEYLLWYALEMVAYAARVSPYDPLFTARYLRAAESSLRELWKRGQA